MRAFRYDVNGCPGGIVLSLFKQGKVEGAVLLTNGFEMGTIARITAKVQFVTGILQHIRSPQCFVAVKRAARKMAGRGCCDGVSCNGGALMPVQFGDDVGVIGPNSANAHRSPMVSQYDVPCL